MGVFARLAALLGLPSRHDALLAGLPSAFLLAYLLGAQFFSHTVTVAVASLVAVAFVLDGLFWHPPRQERG